MENKKFIIAIIDKGTGYKIYMNSHLKEFLSHCEHDDVWYLNDKISDELFDYWSKILLEESGDI